MFAAALSDLQSKAMAAQSAARALVHERSQTGRRQTPQREQQRFALRNGESTADEAMDFVAAMTTPRSSCAARIDGNPKV
jgi:hypothetical protein